MSVLSGMLIFAMFIATPLCIIMTVIVIYLKEKETLVYVLHIIGTLMAIITFLMVLVLSLSLIRPAGIEEPGWIEDGGSAIFYKITFGLIGEEANKTETDLVSDNTEIISGATIWNSLVIYFGFYLIMLLYAIGVIATWKTLKFSYRQLLAHQERRKSLFTTILESRT